MGDLKSCPKCNRRAKDAFSTSWFPVRKCRECGGIFCSECGHGRGSKCPECGATSYSDYKKVYA